MGDLRGRLAIVGVVFLLLAARPVLAQDTGWSRRALRMRLGPSFRAPPSP